MPGRTIVALLALGVIAGCQDKPVVDERCSCTPNNVSQIKPRRAERPMTGEELLAALRRHAQDVRLGKSSRDIKIVDDELRFTIASFCQPCGAWVGDAMRIDQMFPLDRLDEAVRGICMGLVLRDGTIAYGDARPPACGK